MSLQAFLLMTAVLTLAVILFSYWQDRHVTRAAPRSGEVIWTTEGPVHVITRGQDGEKLPVVMLHGSFTNALDMDLDLAPELAKERLVHIPDRPGHGFTPRLADSHRLEVQVAAMRAAIRTKGTERYVVVGQSYGAAAALVWALAYPDDVAGAVLIAPVSHPWPGGIRWYIKAAQVPGFGWFFRRTFIALYARYGTRRGVARSLYGCKAASYYYERTRVPLTFRAEEFRWNSEDIGRLYEQLIPLAKRYREIDIPVEIVAGTHDMTVLLPVHGRKLADTIPDCHLDIIEGGGHALHHSHPQSCLDAIARVDARLEKVSRSPLESALRAIGAVFPQRVASKQEAS
ncbi:MAG: alpha/beta hydrolase [Parvularcula sp.]|jgi:pimeloyl-ACP methyl ester carboxylesterase|nr:alpha/beta hydrolase [Parvularcula sp.]